jgi:PDZ domain
MKFLLVFSCLIASSAAQSSMWEVGAGYSRLGFSDNGIHGGQVSVGANFTRIVGAEFNFNEYEFHDRLYLVGPKFTFGLNRHVSFFLHALPGYATPFNEFAAALGGGVDLKLAPHLIMRPSVEDVITRNAGSTHNTGRGGVAFIFTFGGRTTRTAQTAPVPARPSENVPQLGIRAASHGENVEILEVDPKSTAEATGLRPGDLILSVDGNKVATPADLSAQLTGKSEIILGYMFRSTALGYIAKDLQITLK